MTMQTQPEQQIRFSIAGLLVREFAILTPVVPSDENLQNTFNFGFAFLPDQTVVATITCSYNSNGVNHLKLVLDCAFVIDKEDWSIIEKVDSLVLPKAFATHLMVLTYGTARGVLFAKTEGTIWQFSILPLYDMTTMVSDDMITPKPPQPPQPTPQP
jgi:hypothetical protein